MKLLFVTLILSLLCLDVMAAGNLNYLDVNQEIVYFSTDEAKTSTSPGCVESANADKWALSLDTNQGRAMYSMLMTAMASNIKIGVETANDCNDAEGFERPKRIWYDTESNPVQETVVETITTLKPVAYGTRYYSSNRWRCSLYSLKNSAGEQYMTIITYSNSDQACICGAGSRLVNIGLGRRTSASDHQILQCVIEVETPIINASN